MSLGPFLRSNGGALVLASVAALLPLAIFPGLLDPRTSQRFALQAVLFAIAAATALAMLARRREALAISRDELLVAFFGAWILATSALSSTPASSLLESLPILASLAAWFLFRRFASYPGGFRAVAAGFVLAGLLVAAAGIAQSRGTDVLHYVARQREGKLQILSLLGNPNYVASFLAPVAILCCALAVSCRRWPARIAACAPLVPILYCLVIAGGRAGLLGVAAGGATVACGSIVLVARRRGVSGRAIAAVVAVIVLASVSAAAIGAHSFEDKLRTRLFAAEGLYVRLLPWQVASRLVVRHPLTGIGQGRYYAEGRDALYDFLRQEPDAGIFLVEMRLGKGGAADHLHNDFLQMLVETGVPGIFVFFALVAFAVQALLLRSCSNDGESPFFALCLLGALVCQLVDACFGFPLRLPASSLVFWFLLGIADRTPRPLLRVPAGLPRLSLAIAVSVAAALASLLSVRQALAVRTRVGIAQAKDVLAGNPKNQRILMDAWRLAPFVDPPPYALVNTHIERGSLERALDLLVEMEQHLYMGGVGYQQMATVAWSLGRHEEALRYLDRATTLDPFNPEVLEYAAAVCIDRGLPDEAEAHLRKATLHDPVRPNAYFMLATISEARGDHREAALRYERSLRTLNQYGGTLLFKRSDAEARMEEMRRRSAR